MNTDLTCPDFGSESNRTQGKPVVPVTLDGRPEDKSCPEPNLGQLGIHIYLLGAPLMLRRWESLV